MFSRDAIKHLRLPFSFFLMPVFLFALSQAPVIEWKNVLLIFLVLHVFIYPASNAYNSYMDKDEGSIGGLRNPPKVTKEVLHISILFDLMGLLLSLLTGKLFFLYVLIYVLASKAYSYHGIRLKKYPFIGFFTVVFFQGYFTFYMCYHALDQSVHDVPGISYAGVACLFLIGGVYPLTQVYQHKEDEKNGDKTISMVLGYRGTFIFTAAMFAMASVLLFLYFQVTGKLLHFYILQLFLLPVIIYFSWWFLEVMKNRAHADFDHTMRMNLLASGCMNACFILLVLLNQLA